MSYKTCSPVATVLITRGTLTPRTTLLAGVSTCSTRLLLSPSGESIQSVGPGTAALVTGWKSLPKAGDEVLAGSEGDVKRAKINRSKKKEIELVLQNVEAINMARKADKTSAMLNDCGEQKQPKDRETDKKELNVVVKGDVSGSVEALVDVFRGIGNQHAGVRVVSTGVGDVTESDIMMAQTAKGLFFSFLRPNP